MNNLIKTIHSPDTEEEIRLKIQLRDLQIAYEKEYELEAKPILDRLMQIRESKPLPTMYIVPEGIGVK